jgi:hypothetical protein
MAVFSDRRASEMGPPRRGARAFTVCLNVPATPDAAVGLGTATDVTVGPVVDVGVTADTAVVAVELTVVTTPVSAPVALA